MILAMLVIVITCMAISRLP